VCDAAERHRLAWFFLTDHTDLFDGNGKRLLHVAPEHEFKQRLERIRYIDYYSASLSGNGTRVKMDITAIPFPADHFDAIYCSHVLEHVANDREAMQEFHRVLRCGGWAILHVPLEPGLTATFEDLSITDPHERLKLFGQEDHVRLYGADYADRLREAGFAVRAISSSSVVGEKNVRKWGIDKAESIFLCTKKRE